MPAGGATGVTRDVKVQATFNRSADPATVTGANFTLTGPAGAVGATVSYDDTTKTATLTPSAVLGASTTYTANVLAGIHAADGSPIAPQSWTFTTGSCPCSLFAPTLLPARTGNPVRDGRPAPGPWSRELGVKFTVDQPMTLTAIRFYKDTRENGSHTGTSCMLARHPGCRAWKASVSRLRTGPSVVAVNPTRSEPTGSADSSAMPARACSSCS